MINVFFYSNPADLQMCICRTDSLQGSFRAADSSCSHKFVHSLCVVSDCGMNCHKLCKDQVAFECKNTKGINAVDSPTPSSTPVAMGTTEGGFGGRLWRSHMVFCLFAKSPNIDHVDTQIPQIRTLTSEVINKGM